MELVVVILAVVALASMLVPALQKAHQKDWRIRCLNNQKEIGTDYRLWAGDNGDLVPAQQTISKGGWSDLLTNANAGQYCWTNYAIMASTLGLNPKLLVCPADERRPATNFASDFTNNTHLSYFVGVTANNIYPQSIAGGDRNLGPGTVPDPNYGYSPVDGFGNDVLISGPVCWSLKMHSHGNPAGAGAGNILLGDGSGQQVSSGSFNANWLRMAGLGTNSLGTNQAGIRLVFP